MSTGSDVITTPTKEFNLKAKFDGVDFTLSSLTSPILHSLVTGMWVWFVLIIILLITVLGFSVDADLKAKDRSIIVR